mmetsp:Transcript_55249/g.108080  ORF Transcript_55249/g.108080 Transcript_55249/m.108080 type:complete len:119 (-) Transcript_55249:425-781(-)
MHVPHAALQVGRSVGWFSSYRREVFCLFLFPFLLVLLLSDCIMSANGGQLNVVAFVFCRFLYKHGSVSLREKDVSEKEKATTKAERWRSSEAVAWSTHRGSICRVCLRRGMPYVQTWE